MKLKMLICTLLMCTISIAQTDGREILNSVKQKYLSKKSISYDIEYKIKYFDDSDTLKLYGSLKLLRDAKDKHYGGKIWMEQINDPDINFTA